MVLAAGAVLGVVAGAVGLGVVLALVLGRSRMMAAVVLRTMLGVALVTVLGRLRRGRAGEGERDGGGEKRLHVMNS
jgi:hypothetical protein